MQQRSSPSSPLQPLAFFCKNMEPAQVRYSAFDRELLACCASIRHFRYMLGGRLFTIYTDHKPLTYALGKVADGWTAMQCRQLFYVAEFTTDIRHVPGVDNVVADTLSRPPSHTAEPDSCLLSHTAGPDSWQPALHDQPALHASLHSTISLHSMTCLHSTLLLFLLVWSCWTMSVLSITSKPADMSIY